MHLDYVEGIILLVEALLEWRRLMQQYTSPIEKHAFRLSRQQHDVRYDVMHTLPKLCKSAATDDALVEVNVQSGPQTLTRKTSLGM